MPKPCALAILLVLCPVWGQADVRFADPDLSPQDKLLFRAEADHPGFGSYNTLFWADLDKREVQQLTFFPEQIGLLRGRTVLPRAKEGNCCTVFMPLRSTPLRNTP